MAEALALDTGWDEDELVATREDGTPPISPERWCDGHSSDITAVYPSPPHDCEAAGRMTAYSDPPVADCPPRPDHKTTTEPFRRGRKGSVVEWS